jgi:mRNA interferase HigB
LKNPAELKNDIANASLVGNNRVVFNIKGNDYRLVTYIDFKFSIVFILWLGTHKQYDKIDVKTVSYDKGN